MPDTPYVIVAGYRDIDAATNDFVKDTQVEIEGVIRVTHDEDGNAPVRQTGDHLGRKDAGWDGGVDGVRPVLAAAARARRARHGCTDEKGLLRSSRRERRSTMEQSMITTPRGRR